MLVILIPVIYFFILLFLSDYEKNLKILFLQTQIFTLQTYIDSLPLQNKPRFIIHSSQKVILAVLSKFTKNWKKLFHIFQPECI